MYQISALVQTIAHLKVIVSSQTDSTSSQRNSYTLEPISLPKPQQRVPAGEGLSYIYYVNKSDATSLKI